MPSGGGGLLPTTPSGEGYGVEAGAGPLCPFFPQCRAAAAPFFPQCRAAGGPDGCFSSKMAARKGAGAGAASRGAAGRRGETDTGRSKGVNTFANDGSFMELFKKKMEEEERLRRRREGSVVRSPAAQARGPGFDSWPGKHGQVPSPHAHIYTKHLCLPISK
uniref:Telomerase RNA component interacting RNase n=1 Tax=Callorhinchus milii TaxID=7868 RepID=A0A4W3IFP7_CALMI